MNFNDTGYIDFTPIELELEAMELVQEIVDREEMIEFLIFCGLTAAEIVDRTSAYLEIVA